MRYKILYIEVYLPLHLYNNLKITKSAILTKILISVVFCDSPPTPDVKFGLATIWDGTQIPVGASVTYRCTNLMRLTSDISSSTFELPCLESNNGYFDKNASWPTCALSKLCKVGCSFDYCKRSLKTPLLHATLQ